MALDKIYGRTMMERLKVLERNSYVVPFRRKDIGRLKGKFLCIKQQRTIEPKGAVKRGQWTRYRWPMWTDNQSTGLLLDDMRLRNYDKFPKWLNRRMTKNG